MPTPGVTMRPNPPRPNPPRPTKVSDQFHHSSLGLDCSKPISGYTTMSCREESRPTNAHKSNAKKPKALKFSHKRKGLRIKHNNESSDVVVLNVSQVAAAAPVPTVESLHNGDIANMNRIFLCKFNAFGDQLASDVVWRVFEALVATNFLFALARLVSWLLFLFMLGCPSRSSVQSNSFAKALTFLCSVGFGILSIPYALSERGWVGLILLTVAILCWYPGLLLHRCMEANSLVRSSVNTGGLAFGFKGKTLVSAFHVGAVDGVGFHKIGVLFIWRGLANAICLFVFCYCGHAVFSTLSNSTKDRSQFPKVVQSASILPNDDVPGTPNGKRYYSGNSNIAFLVMHD
ncbi:hypothetical protein Ancab_009605 [Ancistrocladus abbreviatus]